MAKSLNRKFKLLILTFSVALGINLFLAKPANALPTNFAFPIIGPASYSNDFAAPRASGVHHAIDIFANKHQKIIAVVSGTVSFAPVPQPSYGWIIQITDDDGYEYRYIHINNDNPGTDDGAGGPMLAYAPYMIPGNRVVRGQHLGYVGDSGNAETTPPHLHFEVERPNGSFFNPYNELNEATRKSKPVEPPPYPFEILPYGALKSGLNVAMGDTDDDGESEVISAPGAGGGPHIKIFETNHTQIKGFFAYDPALRIGIDVASGDVDNDGTDEIITAPGPGGGPHIKVFRANGTLMDDFSAYSSTYRGGVRVAAGDVDGDGEDEIITGPMAGGGPHIKAFEVDGTPVTGFFAYNTANRDGIDVASGDIDNDGTDEIITAPGPGSGPNVRAFELAGTRIRNFFAYDKTFRGGVRLSSGNVQLSSAGDEIVTTPESAGGPQTKLFNGQGMFQDDDFTLENWWRGFYDVAAGENTSFFGTGTNRRASLIETEL